MDKHNLVVLFRRRRGTHFCDEVSVAAAVARRAAKASCCGLSIWRTNQSIVVVLVPAGKLERKLFRVTTAFTLYVF